MRQGKVGARRAIQDLESEQFSSQAELRRRAYQPLQAELARVGAAVDLAIEEHVARFDAQAIGRSPDALAQPANIQQLLAQRRAFGGGDEQLVAELAADTVPRGDQVVSLK